jgi:hypothetical protein
MLKSMWLVCKADYQERMQRRLSLNFYWAKFQDVVAILYRYIYIYLHLVFSITVTCSLERPARTIGTVIEYCFIITKCLPVALYFFFSLSRFHAPNPPGPAGEPRNVRPDSALLTYRILYTPPTNTCKEVSHSIFTSRSTNLNLHTVYNITLNCKALNLVCLMELALV